MELKKKMARRNKTIARSTKFAPTFESLEQRQLLAANVLANGLLQDINLNSAGDTHTLQLEVNSQESLVLAFDMHGQDGLNPGQISIESVSGHTIAPIASVNGTTDSMFLAELGPGSYEITVLGDGGTTGSYDFSVSLVGDLDGDTTVSNFEQLWTKAAIAQSNGSMNSYTASYYSHCGIPINQNLYDLDLDANRNGSIDSQDYSCVIANVGKGTFSIDLTNDSQAPVITAGLANDTGTSDTDGITTDITITGNVTDPEGSAITALQASIDGGSYVDVTFDTNGDFTLSQATLETIAGSSLEDGQAHTLSLVATDEYGNISEQAYTVDFELDIVAPAAPGTPDLTDDSDLGDSDTDNLTADNTPTFTITTEAGATVELYSDIDGLIGEGVADSNGDVTITATTLTDGAHNITAKATDIAGNEGVASSALVVTIDTALPTAPAHDLAAASDTGTAGDQYTSETSVTIEGTTDPNIKVMIVGTDMETVSDASGNFSFDNVSLAFGENDITVRAISESGAINESTTTYVQNNAPTATTIDPVTINENDGQILIASLSDIFGDVNLADGDTLSHERISDLPAWLTGTTITNGYLYATTEGELYGTSTITIKATDSYGESVEGTVNLTVAPENDVPGYSSLDSTISGYKDEQIIINNIWEHFSDEETPSNELTVELFTATHGTAVIENGTLTFTPDAGYYGNQASVLLNVTDKEFEGIAANTQTLMLVFNIANQNHVVVANDVTADPVNEDNVLDILIDDTVAHDEETALDDLTFEIASGTDNGNGVFSINGGTVQIVEESGNRYFRFTPTENWSGTTSFDYTVTDEALEPVADNPASSKTATVTITVVPVNDAPVADDAERTIDENGGPVEIAIADLVSDVETAFGDLTIAIDSVTGGTADIVDVSGTPTFRFTPTDNFNGTASFTYSVKDTGDGSSAALTSTGTVTITINPVNDAPEADSASLTTDEDTITQQIDLYSLVKDTETVDEDLVFSISGETNGTVTLVDGHLVQFTPNANFNNSRGSASFTYTVTDTGDNGAAAISTGPITITVSVTPVNDAPVAEKDSQSVPIDEPSIIDVLANDSDVDNAGTETDTLTIILAEIDGTDKGSVEIKDGKLKYTPVDGATEAYQVTINYTIEDSHGAKDTAEVTLAVTPNTPPTAVAESKTISENGSWSYNVLDNDFDSDGDTITISSYDVTTTKGIAINLASDGSFTYDLSNSTLFNGLGYGETATDTFTYTISDGNGGTDTATVTITITGVNNVPVANNDTGDEVGENGTHTGNVLTNDTDTDTNDVLTVTTQNVTSEKGIAVTINSDGSYTYDLSNSTVFDYLGTDATTTDTFSYSISDGHGGTATATATITINGVNDIPVGVADGVDNSISTDNTTSIDIDVLANDTDAETTNLTVGGSQTTSTLGATITINNDGTINYDPTTSTTLQGLASDQQMTDTFSYTVSDGTASSAAVTVSVLVSGSVNVAPQVDNPIANILLDDGDPQPALIDLTTVFSDANGHTLSFTASSSNPDLVTVTIVDGTKLQVTYVDYAPNQDRTPADITVTATETNSGESLTAQNTFTVTVAPIQPMEVYLVVRNTATDTTISESTTTLPTSISSVSVGDSYVVEIWMINKYPNGTSSLAVGRGDLQFDNTLGSATSLSHAGRFDSSTEGWIDNANGEITEFGGASFSNSGNGGVAPNYTRLGYVTFNATNAGTQKFDFDVDAIAMLSGGSPLDLSQITVITASVTHEEVADTYSFDLGDSSVIVSGSIGGESLSAPTGYLDADRTNQSLAGSIAVTLDNYDSPSTLSVVSGSMDTGLYEGSVNNTLQPGPGGVSSGAAANLALANDTIQIAFRNLNFSFSSSTLPVTAGITFNASNIDIGLSSGTLDYRTTNGSSSGSIDLTSKTISIESNISGSIYNFGSTKSITYICEYTIDLSSHFGAGSEIVFRMTLDASYDPSVPIMGTVSAEDTPTDVAMSVVKDPTATDAKGEVASVPQSEAWLDEWDSHWVEVWVKTEEGSGVNYANVDIEYNADYFTATEIEYSPAVIGDFTGNILTDGIVSDFGGAFDSSGVGVNGYVLLGRVKFESLEGDGVALDVESFGIKPFDLGLELSVNDLDVNGVTNATVGIDRAPTTELWAMPYDVNDDDAIDLMDVAQFVSLFQTNVFDSDSPFTQVVDYNNDAKVDLSDLSYLLANYGSNKTADEDISFPETFTQRWIGSGLDTTGDSSAGELLDAATDIWQTMLGTDTQIDIQLVVTDLGGKQLAEAEILATDENGQPIAGRITLDDDAAGLGWYSQIDGTPDAEMYDLYTVLLHEIGHTLGFMGSYDGFADNLEIVADQVTFVDGDIYVTMDSSGNHVADTSLSDDLMSSTIDPGVRKLPSELDAQMILAAYEAAAGGASGFAAVSASITAADTMEAVTIATTDFNQIDGQLVGDMTWDRLIETRSKKDEETLESTDASTVDALFAYESNETSTTIVRSDSESDLDLNDEFAIGLAEELVAEENTTDEAIDSVFDGWNELL